MIQFKLLFVVLVLSFVSNAQVNRIRIGDKAPEIHITDWIDNVPQNKSFHNKFIVLEFWATWCGPCLAEVPHLNELQRKFASDSLMVISITNEEAVRVKRLLKLKEFKSTVVSDQTNTTLANYGNTTPKGDIKKLPYTVLIDNKGIVKWIGTPGSLSEEVMQHFLTHEELVKVEVNKKKLALGESIFARFLNLMQNDTINYYFSIDRVNQKKFYDQGKVKKSSFFLESASLDNILWSVFNYHKEQLIIEKGLNANRYDLLYKNRKFTNDSIAVLEKKILDYIGVLKGETTKNRNVTNLVVINKAKLVASVDKEQSVSRVDDNKIYSKFTLIDLVNDLNKITREVLFYYDGKDNNYYNFILKTEDLNAIKNSLLQYGITFKTTTKNITVYTFAKHN